MIMIFFSWMPLPMPLIVALDCGTELPLDIETACNIARIIDAAQISANEGREVKIS